LIFAPPQNGARVWRGKESDPDLGMEGVEVVVELGELKVDKGATRAWSVATRARSDLRR